MEMICKPRVIRNKTHFQPFKKVPGNPHFADF